MINIKRYPNRKLYNTGAKQYVTLDGIAGLIRDGADVQIIDHKSGEDLTTVTLTQIIVEQEKKPGGFIPRPILTGLVQSGGQTLSNLRRSLASPLGFFEDVDCEIQRRLTKLIESGEIDEQQGKVLKKKLSSAGGHPKDLRFISERNIEKLLSDHGVPTRSDLQELSEHLNVLLNKLEELELDID